MNIFPYETLASKDVFFGRDKEIKEIQEFVLNSNNLLIFSKRRLGKSSLIKELIYKLEKNKENIICIYIDIYDITSAEDFAKALLQGLVSTYKGDIKESIKKLASLFKRTRVEPTFDPFTMKYGIKPVVTSLSFEEMMDDFFDSLYLLCKKNKILLAIDEFQQISTIKNKKIDAKFRKYIQDTRSKNISYIFLGSKRHLLTSLFEYKSALYELATPFNLDSISTNDTFNYVQQYLKVDKNIIEHIFDICDGETKLMQHIFFLLYSKYKNNTISEDLVQNVLDEILSFKDTMYRALLDTFSLNQKKALKLMLEYKSGLFSKEILNKQDISKNVMQSAINSLIKREIIDKKDDIFFIPDRTFELWGKMVYIKLK